MYSHHCQIASREFAENNGRDDFGGFMFVKDWVWRYHPCRRLLFSGYCIPLQRIVLWLCVLGLGQGPCPRPCNPIPFPAITPRAITPMYILPAISRQGAISRPGLYHAHACFHGLYHSQGYITPTAGYITSAGSFSLPLLATTPQLPSTPTSPAQSHSSR